MNNTETQPTDTNVVAMPDRSNKETNSWAELVQKHPGKMLAGSFVVGIVASALLPKRPIRKLSHLMVDAAEAAAAASALLGKQAWDAAEGVGHTSAELSRKAIGKAEAAGHAGAGLGRRALDRVEAAGHVGLAAGRSAWHRVEATGSELRGHGEATAHRIASMLTPAEEAAVAARDEGRRFSRKAAASVSRSRH